MCEQIASRLAALKQDFQIGQLKLQELDQQQTALRETLFRISGAIQVLEELLASSTEKPNGSAEKRNPIGQ
jgi:hypothetical protein